MFICTKKKLRTEIFNLLVIISVLDTIAEVSHLDRSELNNAAPENATFHKTQIEEKKKKKRKKKLDSFIEMILLSVVCILTCKHALYV